MNVAGVWAGLATSPFLADVDRRDRDGPRIVITVAVGVVAGAAAAMATMFPILGLYALASGLGGDGLAGLGKVALQLKDATASDLKPTLVELVLAAAVNAAFAAAFVGVAALIASHRFRRYLTAAAGVRWRLLGVGLLLSMIVLFPLVAADRLASGSWATTPVAAIAPGGWDRLVYGLSALLLIPAAAAEELFFRGWLLRLTAAFTRRPAVLIGLTAVAFATAHLDFSAEGLLIRVLMGGCFAYMTLRLGGIEFSTGAHAANNILIVLLIEPLTPKTLAGSSTLSFGMVVAGAVMVIGYVAITEAVIRVPALRRMAGVKAEALSAVVEVRRAGGVGFAPLPAPAARDEGVEE